MPKPTNFSLEQTSFEGHGRVGSKMIVLLGSLFFLVMLSGWTSCLVDLIGFHGRATYFRHLFRFPTFGRILSMCLSCKNGFTECSRVKTYNWHGDMLQLILEQFFSWCCVMWLFPQALIYVSFVLISCALFSKFWIEASMLRGREKTTIAPRRKSRGLSCFVAEVSGSSPRDVAKQLRDNSMVFKGAV